MKDLYTVFEVEFYDGFNKQWVKEVRFYCGDITDVDVKTDARFYEIKDKRLEAKMLGKGEIKLPIEDKDYPVMLDNGIMLEKYEKMKYKEE